MRKISPAQIAVFAGLFTAAALLALATACLLVTPQRSGNFHGVAWLLVFILSFYLWAIAAYRLSHRFLPLVEGELPPGSPGEFAYQVDTLFRLVLFYPLIRTYFIPTPLMRLVYLALGARMGDNTYSGGAILDPALTELGANTIIGHDAVLFSHELEGEHMALQRIRIGDNVTIGAKATVMAGVQVGDGAIVSVGAVVTKGTVIGPGETWGGTPARRLSPATVADEQGASPDA
ncbi:MAG: transferase [Halioglobus sp.]|nr:transferase [Halioglobus sp.]